MDEFPGDSRLISRAGIILRTLSPHKIGTLWLVSEETQTQRIIAEQIDRTPAAVSNYLESLEELPVSLVESRGSHRKITPVGEEILGLLTRFIVTQGGLDLRSRELDSTFLSEIEQSMDPLHRFRGEISFHTLYAIGVESSSWFIDDLDTVLFEDVVSHVKSWDESATKKQIRARVTKFDDAGSMDVDNQQLRLTEKGLEQCRLLDQVMQIIDREIGNPVLDDQLSIEETDGEIPTVALPPTNSVRELREMIEAVERDFGPDQEIRLELSVDLEH